jgi:hypothetical protein
MYDWRAHRRQYRPDLKLHKREAVVDVSNELVVAARYATGTASARALQLGDKRTGKGGGNALSLAAVIFLYNA